MEKENKGRTTYRLFHITRLRFPQLSQVEIYKTNDHASMLTLRHTYAQKHDLLDIVPA